MRRDFAITCGLGSPSTSRAEPRRRRAPQTCSARRLAPFGTVTRFLDPALRAGPAAVVRSSRGGPALIASPPPRSDRAVRYGCGGRCLRAPRSLICAEGRTQASSAASPMAHRNPLPDQQITRNYETKPDLGKRGKMGKLPRSPFRTAGWMAHPIRGWGNEDMGRQRFDSPSALRGVVAARSSKPPLGLRRNGRPRDCATTPPRHRPLPRPPPPSPGTGEDSRRRVR